MRGGAVTLFDGTAHDGTGRGTPGDERDRDSFPGGDDDTGRAPLGRRAVAGIWALSVAVIAMLLMTFIPSGYVIQQPGPVYDTLGTAKNAEGEDVPLIAVDGADTYPTGGTLDLTTVQVRGNRETTPTWLEIVGAWLDPSRAVVPIDRVYPENQSVEERDEQNAALMITSQHQAIAAALVQLGYDLELRLRVATVSEDGPADGQLQPGDIIRSVDGRSITDTAELRALLTDGEGAPVEFIVGRDDADVDVTVVPDFGPIGDEEDWRVGIAIQPEYDDFPVDVTIQLDNVGGPSAGMMFALGIIDELTPGELTGGQNVAGTGTITPAGEVGPIGGIRQKLYGARDAGAEFFLAPAANCAEVVGHVPDGLRVISTATLQESMDALETIASGGNLDTLPTCTR